MATAGAIWTEHTGADHGRACWRRSCTRRRSMLMRSPRDCTRAALREPI